MEVDTDTLLKTIGEQTVQLGVLRKQGQLAEARNTVYENAMREAGMDPDEVIAKASDAAVRAMMGQLPAAEPEAPEPVDAEANGKP